MITRDGTKLENNHIARLILMAIRLLVSTVTNEH